MLCEEHVDQRPQCVYEPLGPKVLEVECPEARTCRQEYDRVRSQWPCSKNMLGVIFSEKLLNIARRILGPQAVLFNEQYIVKQSRSGIAGSFKWHRDSDSLLNAGISLDNISYISIWVPLDDATRDNGCLFVRPMVHDGCDPIPLEIPRGSAVVMSHLLFHMSGPNSTLFQRRAWMPQFSSQAILTKNGTPVSLAIPL